jgi:acetyltransferase-like isoleucine patch superfamily enzyme
MTLVRGNIPEDSIVIGMPGKVIGPTAKIRFKKDGKPVYPWRRHFHRGYPEEITQVWKNEFPDG